ncbi:MAG: 3-dehydroquinate synthase [Rhodospirillaceae bacterium]
MRETVQVELGARSYDIVIGPGVMADVGRYIADTIGRKRQLIIVTDQNVAVKHLHTLVKALKDEGLVHSVMTPLAPGEHTKSFCVLEQLLDELLGHGIERSTVLVALGGGIIGDLVGFAAAVALRGLEVIQVPTTLLSQIDSSVGGKTGINSRHGKNLIGAFHQPSLVLADTTVIDTLDLREIRAGYAEMVKYGLINDPNFFAWLEVHGKEVIEGAPEARRYAIATCCRAKAAIVGADERESGQRALLNLGHTFGHALEAACNFGDTLRHGEAVALGMVLAFDLSVELGLCPAADALRLRVHLSELGLPTGAADVPALPWHPPELLHHMTKDKKVCNGRINFILVRGIGQSFVAENVDMANVLKLLEARTTVLTA